MGSFDSSNEDRISELPDEIITHILSFLPLNQAVVTSVLSKRWKKQWVYYAKYLHFDHKYKHNLPMDQKLNFTRKVNQLLKFLKSPTIEEFRVCIELGASFKTDIDNWLKFALDRRVQRLELYLNGSIKRWCLVVKFEQYLLEFLPSPNVINCDQFKSLKSLSLKAVNVSGDVVEKVLATCPVLEHLSINQSLVLTSLKVTGPSVVLKYLEVSYCFKMKFFEIRNLTNLVSFTYMGDQLYSFSLSNVPQLVELSLGGECSFYFDQFLPKFSCCFSKLETLELETAIAPEYDQVNPPELPNLRRFILTCVLLRSRDPNHLKYIPFIMAAPLLEKFVLRQYWYRYPLEEDDRRLIQRVNGRHERLQEVEFDGYYGSKAEQELVLYFTNSITSLQKIIIRPYPCDAWRQRLRQGQSNSSYKKSIKKKRAACRRHAKNHIGAKESGELPKQSSNEPQTSTVTSASETFDNSALITKDAQPETGVVASKPKYRHEFYQKPEVVVVTIFAKGVPAKNVVVDYGEQIISVVIDVPGQDAYTFQPPLFGKIIPPKCKYEVLSTKIEIRLAKVEPIQWTSLE